MKTPVSSALAAALSALLPMTSALRTCRLGERLRVAPAKVPGAKLRIANFAPTESLAIRASARACTAYSKSSVRCLQTMKFPSQSISRRRF